MAGLLIVFSIVLFSLFILQGKAKKTRKFASVKRLLNPKDARLSVSSFALLGGSLLIDIHNSKENQLKEKKREEEAKSKAVRRV